MLADLQSRAAAAAQWLAGRWSVPPLAGIILGTGSGLLAEDISDRESWPYASIPGFPRSTATGHKGQLVCGWLSGQPVIAMQGRFHLYEGYDVDLATLPIHVMRQLGVRRLLITNAAGGVSPWLRKGDLMLIRSHLDLMLRTTPALAGRMAGGRPVVRADAFLDRNLADAAAAIARRSGFSLPQGVYAGLLGPNYETRAEYRMLRRLGADAVGMSTVPEIALAAALGLPTLAVSIITNEARPDAPQQTSGEEVVEAGETAAPNLRTLIGELVRMA